MRPPWLVLVAVGVWGGVLLGSLTWAFLVLSGLVTP